MTEHIPERALIAAVIEQAVKDTKTKHSRDSAWRWIHDDDPRPFGFVFCCNALGIDHEWARKKIKSKATMP